MTSAELITELQAARPAADGALRDRVRAIAAAEPVRRSSPFARLSRYSPRRFALVAVPATAVVLFAVAGVAGLLDSGSRPGGVEAIRNDLSSQSATVPGTTTTPTSELAPELKAGATATDAATPAPTTGRAQRYSAQLTLSVKNIDALSDATQQALRITRDLGGYLVTASYATTDSGTSSLTLKVPTANVQQAIVRLSDLGKIVGQQIQIDDLQGQVDELTKRETALRVQIARLSARLAATDISAETRATLEARRDAARSALAQVRVASAQVERRGALRDDPADDADAAVVDRRARPVALRQRRRPRRRDPCHRGDGRALRARDRRPARPARPPRLARPAGTAAEAGRAPPVEPSRRAVPAPERR